MIPCAISRNPAGFVYIKTAPASPSSHLPFPISTETSYSRDLKGISKYARACKSILEARAHSSIFKYLGGSSLRAQGCLEPSMLELGRVQDYLGAKFMGLGSTDQCGHTRARDVPASSRRERRRARAEPSSRSNARLFYDRCLAVYFLGRPQDLPKVRSQLRVQKPRRLEAASGTVGRSSPRKLPSAGVRNLS